MTHSRRALPVAFLVSLCSWPAFAGAGSQANIPKAWIHKLTDSPTDLNHNGYDDAIEGLPPTQQIELLVDLTGCLAPADRTRLSAFGTIDFESPYVATIHMSNVLVSTVPQIAADPSVAFVEMDDWMYHTLDVSNPAIQVKASAAYPPPPPPAAPITVHEKFPGVEGNTIMAIFDTGIDDTAGSGVTHQALQRFDRGLICPLVGLAPCAEGNPDDTSGPGTHDAAVAIGQGEGGSNSLHAGIAPQEGLYDIQLPPDPAFLPRFRIRRSHLIVAIATLLSKMNQFFDSWNPQIAYIPWSTCSPDNGQLSISASVDQLAAKGVFVVTGMGNCSTCLGKQGFTCTTCPCSFLPGPAAAAGAFTVGAVDDHNTPSRVDDTIWPDNFQGPIPPGPQKPDLVAPGVDIASAQSDTVNGYVSMTGTSSAAAHVAGCAALILQAQNIDPDSVKKVLQETADPHGQVVPNNTWGYGILNCFAAVDKVNSAQCADLYFDGACGGFLQPPCYWHPGLRAKDWLVEGVQDKILADIHNNGPAFSNPSKVKIRLDGFSNGDNGYEVCTVDVPVIAPGATTEVSCDVVPDISGAPPGVVHACLFGDILTSQDCVFSNNHAQHNEEIQQSRSPATAQMFVENTAKETVSMEIQGVFDCNGGPCNGWTFTPSSNSFVMAPDDCSQQIMLSLTPQPPIADRRATVHVNTIGHGSVTHDLGGVTFIGWLACPTTNLLFSSKTTFGWTPPSGYSSCAGNYDVARGTLPIPKYPSTTVRGDFRTAVCVADEISTAQFTDSTPVPPGSGFYYLTRVGGPSPGSWDTMDAKQKGLADDTLKACP